MTTILHYASFQIRLPFRVPMEWNLPGTAPVRQAFATLNATIYRLIERGKLPAIKVLGRLYVRPADVLALVEIVRPKERLPPQQSERGTAQRKEVSRWCRETLERAKL